LKEIVEKGSSLLARIEGGFVSVPSANPRTSKQIETRLKEWRKVVADGDEESFIKRLALDNLDPNKVRPFLGNVKMQDSEQLPDCMEILNEILLRAKDFPVKDLDELNYEKYPFLKKDAPVPFEEILLPFIAVARDKLTACAGDNYGLLDQKAHAAFERFLLQRLSEISSRVFEVEFGTFLALRQIHGTPQDKLFPGSESRVQYLNFAKKNGHGKFAGAF
jgi:lantibiotic modifying enzyme